MEGCLQLWWLVVLCTCGADARWLHFAVLRFAVINNAWDTELTGTDLLWH